MTEVVPSPEGAAAPAAPQDALGRFLLGWSQLSALCGVALLLGICLLSTWSVLGRALFDSPVMGDVEIVQIICSLAIASFLPYAQMKNAHVIVDFFTHGASARTRASMARAAAGFSASKNARTAGSSTNGIPISSAQTSFVISSSVGPRPPPMITRSALESAVRKTSVMRSRLSPTVVW